MSTDDAIAAAYERVARAQQELQDATDELITLVASKSGGVDLAVLEQSGRTGREAATMARRAAGSKPWRPPGATGPDGPWKDPRES
jgi:hypothetical protein